MKNSDQKPNQYNYITSKNGVRLTERQWAKRFIGIIAQAHHKELVASMQSHFFCDDLKRIQKLVENYSQLLTNRRSFDFEARYSPKVSTAPRHRLEVDV